MKLENITSENWQFIIDWVEKLPQGVNLWYKGCPYPRRVYYNLDWQPNHPSRILNALGNVKKCIFLLASFDKLAFPRTLSVKKYEAFLWKFSMLADWNLSEFYITDKDYSVPVWEIGQYIKHFLVNLGFSQEIAVKVAQMAMMILEFDNAYRYRLQDLCGTIMKKELLNSPISTLKKIMRINSTRETYWTDVDGVSAKSKIHKLKILAYLLYIPKVRKAFKKAIQAIDLEKIKFNDNDRFHLSFWKGYEFEGKTFDQRYTPYQELYKIIPFQKKDNQQVINNFLLGI